MAEKFNEYKSAQRRSRRNRVIAYVCGGLGEFLCQSILVPHRLLIALIPGGAGHSGLSYCGSSFRASNLALDRQKAGRMPRLLNLSLPYSNPDGVNIPKATKSLLSVRLSNFPDDC
jgi:hypothetical protein